MGMKRRSFSEYILFSSPSSLDKELVRLVEEKTARELEAEEAKLNSNCIQVKPIIQTISTVPPVSSPSDNMTIHEKIDDLLR